MLVRLTFYDGSVATLPCVIPGTIVVDYPPPGSFYDLAGCNVVTLQCYGNDPASHRGVLYIEQEHEDILDDIAPLVPTARMLERRI